MPPRAPINIDRRTFLRATTLGAAAVALPNLSTAGAASWASRLQAPAARPVRVRGRVRSGSRGVGRVAISDGLTVVDTAGDGRFELVTSADRRFLSLSVPSGFRIPQNPTGTARFYQSITPDARGEMDAVFDLERLPSSDERHAVFLLADVQTEDAQEMAWFHEQTVPDVHGVLGDLRGVEAIGIACGDIMFDHLELYPEYERAVGRMGIPFFQVVGNHDLDLEARTDEASTATFSRHFGPRAYSFNRGAVHYVVLDDVFWHGAGYLGYLGADQLAWLEADLRRVEPGAPVIVALHIPVLGSRHLRDGASRPGLGISVANREALYRLLEPFQAHILAGHTHENEHVFEHGVHEHVSGTACGAWWSGPICGDGTPSGYSLYEIAGEAVTWRYKTTGSPFTHQLRTYPRGSDPAAPDEVVANVWDADPDWTVVWYEDGERKGAMGRRVGRDPLSVDLHAGPELPPRRPWVEPYPVGHLYYAPVAREAQQIRVEATDRFGRTYTAPVLEPQGGRTLGR